MAAAGQTGNLLSVRLQTSQRLRERQEMGAVHDGELDLAKNLADSTPVRRRELFLLLLLASVQFTSIVDFMVVMPLGPQLMRTLKITPAEFGWIVSSYTIAAGLAAILASSIMDRFGRKAAFLTLYAGFLVGTLLCGLARGYHALLSARVITGMFGGILGGMAMAIVGDVFPEERRGLRHRGLDVGLRGGLGLRRADRHLSRQHAGLERAVPGPGGPGHTGLHR